MNETKPTIYDFTDYRAFLSSYLEHKKSTLSYFSLRTWCQRLGLKSPSTLNMILKGTRNPGEEVIHKFKQYFNFNSEQKEYFEGLVRLSKCNGHEERRIEILEKLRELHPKKNISIMDFETFSTISKWYFLAIREMIDLRDFKESPTWIASKLKNKITSKEVKDALDIMKKLNILTIDKSGKLVQTKKQIGTEADVSQEAIKRFHEQMLMLAQSSIREVSVEERDISGTTFNIDPKDLPLLKNELRKIRQSFYQKYESKPGKATYQLNIQLFPLTNFNQKGGK